MDLENIKKNFYYYKDKQGLTWPDLAAKAGIKSYTQIINYFNKPGLTLASLEKLANLVNVDPWQLLKPTPEANTSTRPNIIACPYCGKLLTLQAATQDDTTPPQKTLF